AAVTTERGVLVAYRDRGAEEVRDIFVTRREGGRWSPPRAVHADHWRIAGCPVNGPALDARGSHVAIAWYTAAADTPRVYVAFSEDAGAHFGTPARIDDGNPLGRVHLALLADGSALATCHEAGGREYRFCGAGCLAKFRADPERYLSKPAATPHRVEPSVAAPRGQEWTCPMHPQIVRDGPGACPICGMALEPRTVTLDGLENPELTDMRRRLIASAILTAPLLLFMLAALL